MNETKENDMTEKWKKERGREEARESLTRVDTCIYHLYMYTGVKHWHMYNVYNS